MGSGIVQLVAYGAQDLTLTGNPEITFFEIDHKRHTNFAVESIEQTFNGPADFGRRVTCTISRNADLIREIALVVTLPSQTLTTSNRFRWLNYPGHRLVKKVEVEIGGQTIDRQYGEWMHIWHLLSCPPGLRAKYEELVGQSADLVLMKTGNGVALDATCAASELTNSCVPRAGTPAKTIYVPLQFWFNKNPGLALPLIALQYHEVKINIEFAQFYECCYYDGGYTPTAAQSSLVAASLYVDYVYLDTDERKVKSQKPHKYLIEQLQFTGSETITSTSYKARLQGSHPVKALYWVVQRDSYVTCSTTPSSIAWHVDAGGAQPFNFTDDWSTEGLVMDVLGRPGLSTTTGTIPTFTGPSSISWFVPQFAGSTGAAMTTGSEIGVADSAEDGSDNFIEGTTNYLLAKVLLATGVKCQGKNPVEVAKLTLNGTDRFSEREGRYFDVFQPWQHQTNGGGDSTGVNMYSFAERPEEYNPTGQLNFSRIDQAILHLTLAVNMVRSSRTCSLRYYLKNYNELRVISGMGGLLFA